MAFNTRSAKDDAYIASIQRQETPQQEALRMHTQNHPYHSMQITRDQGALLSWLVTILQPKSIIEIGVFTGYSSLCMAQAMPDEGRIIACDKNKHWVDEALPYWQDANIIEKIDIRIGDAIDTLKELCSSAELGQTDLIFIDADKTGYPEYYEAALKLLKPGGTLILDNIFLMGRVFTEPEEKKTASLIRTLNLKIRNDPRVTHSVLPCFDGMTFIKKL